MPSFLALVCGLTTLLAAVTAARWWTRRYDSLGRQRPFPVWSVSLLLVIAVAAAVPVVRRHHLQDRLSDVASQLAGRTVAVHCQTTTGELLDAGAELGFVRFDADGVPEPATTIKHGPCGDLRAYANSSHRDPTREQVIAVHVLTHEAMHMRGQSTEDLAECEAVQRDAKTAELLGATPRQARELALTYWITVYPDMPDGYRSSGCRPGGELDERLGSAPWVS